MGVEDLWAAGEDSTLPYPGLVLTAHVAVKGVQTGAVLATVAASAVALKNLKKVEAG
jgi:hypothetical protein